MECFNIFIFFQYGQWCFSGDAGGTHTTTGSSETVPGSEEEKDLWEKAREFFTGKDPLEEMRALNDELKQLIESNRKLREDIQTLIENDQKLMEEDRRLMEEISKLKQAQ